MLVAFKYVGRDLVSMKELIPGAGEKSAKERLRELEEQAGTLPVIFALLFTEAIKILVAGVPVPFLEAVAGYQFILEALKFFLLAIAIAVAYVYEAERRKYIGMAKEKAQEKTEEAKEKAESVGNKPDYELDLSLFGKDISCTLDFDKNNK